MIRKPISVKHSSFFQKIPILPDDPILGLTVAFQLDTNPHKVNLGVGAYRDKDGKPQVFQAVTDAEKKLFDQSLFKEYQPISGNQKFCLLTQELIFGNSLSLPCLFAQTLGGSFALRLGAEFLSKSLNKDSIAITLPSWPNHQQIFKATGLLPIELPYIDEDKKLRFKDYIESIQKLPDETAILFHANCHNPTGLDPSSKEWEELANLCQEKHLLPFFDMAYQGFGEGLKEDSSALLPFTKRNIECLIAYSFSKNMGLYGERVGAFFVLTHDESLKAQIDSHIKRLIRVNHSSPPLHGARIAQEILSNPTLKISWEEELTQCRQRVHFMRTLLADLLQKDFLQIKQQKGMFAYTNLMGEKAQRLRKDYSIYIQEDGRLSLSGLNEHNTGYVVDAIKRVL